jgi:hypothetical protein
VFSPVAKLKLSSKSKIFPVFSLIIREFDRGEQFASDCVIRRQARVTPALSGPEGFRGEFRRLTAIDYLLDDVRSQERETNYPAHITFAQPSLAFQFRPSMERGVPFIRRRET